MFKYASYLLPFLQRETTLLWWFLVSFPKIEATSKAKILLLGIKGGSKILS